ncbi:MAG: GNAT family N-acetyltransferase [Candidatus Dormibacteraceae bacterium]
MQLGGISGYTHWQWLIIGHLWISDGLRRGGLGMLLLKTIEDASRERGCIAAWLDTYSFQSKPFYSAQGYVQFGELPDYPPGYKRHFLWKRLDSISTK